MDGWMDEWILGGIGDRGEIIPMVGSGCCRFLFCFVLFWLLRVVS